MFWGREWWKEGARGVGGGGVESCTRHDPPPELIIVTPADMRRRVFSTGCKTRQLNFDL